MPPRSLAPFVDDDRLRDAIVDRAPVTVEEILNEAEPELEHRRGVSKTRSTDCHGVKRSLTSETARIRNRRFPMVCQLPT